MCIFTSMRDLVSGNSLQITAAIVESVRNIIDYYEQHATSPEDKYKKDAFLDALIQLIQTQKSKQEE